MRLTALHVIHWDCPSLASKSNSGKVANCTSCKRTPFKISNSSAKRPYEGRRRNAVIVALGTAFCTPHVMRHTAITALVKQKVDVPTIQKISGHKTAAMVLHYVHIFREHIDDAIGGLNIGIPGTVTPELHTGAEIVPDAPTQPIPIKRRKSVA